jgi:hypothetical protein
MIKPSTDANVQLSTVRVPASDFGEVICRFSRRREGEAGRAPGALADSDRSLTLEQTECDRNIRTIEPASALNRGVMIAEMCLELLDCRAETRKIALSYRRQGPHEDEAAEVGGGRFVKWRKFGERSILVGAMHALPARIKNNQHTPAIRKRHVADNRRSGGRRSPSAIDYQTAPIKQANADAGARTAAESDRITTNVERHSVQPTQSGRHRKCDLCAGTEARVRRYNLLDCDGMGARNSERALHGDDMMSHPIAFGTRDLRARRRSDRDLGPWATDGEADATKGAAQPPVEIQKAEM